MLTLREERAPTAGTGKVVQLPLASLQINAFRDVLLGKAGSLDKALDYMKEAGKLADNRVIQSMYLLGIFATRVSRRFEIDAVPCFPFSLCFVTFLRRFSCASVPPWLTNPESFLCEPNSENSRRKRRGSAGTGRSVHLATTATDPSPCSLP